MPFTGHLSYALAYDMGDTSGTNPTGTGAATWEGIAEAVSLRTFERRLGTATLVIADFSAPRVSVALPSGLLRMTIMWRATSMAWTMRKPTAFLTPRPTPARSARNETIERWSRVSTSGRESVLSHPVEYGRHRLHQTSAWEC